MKEEQNPETSVPQKKKLKRHFWLSVPVIAFLLFLFGQILGTLLVGLCAAPFPDLSGGTAFLLMYLSFIGIDLLTILYCALCEKDILRSFLHRMRGGMRGNTGRYFAIGLLAGFLMNGICILIAWLHGDLHFSVGHFDVLYLILALLAVCVQSGAEELVTRGYMLGALRARYPAWAAIIVNSLFFGALHLGNNGISALSLLQIILIGVLLSLIVCRYDSLWMCIAIHTAWNFTQNFLFGLPNSGIVSESSFLHLEAAKDSAFYDVAFGVEGTVTAVVVIGLAAAAVLIRSQGKQSVKAVEMCGQEESCSPDSQKEETDGSETV